MVIELNDGNFSEKVLKSKGVAIVDFWATWCAPCRMQAPIFDKTSENLSESVCFYKVNVDENLQTATDLNIMSIPTLVVFKDGQVVEKLIGLSEENEIESVLKKYL